MHPKFVGSSLTNVTLSVLKDKAFAAMFGTGVARPMSYTSMGKNTSAFIHIQHVTHRLSTFSTIMDRCTSYFFTKGYLPRGIQ